MKVLIIHCAYKFQGGEDTVVLEEMELLKRSGVEVDLLPFSNVSNTLLDTIQLPFNFRSYKKTLKKIAEFKPDIIHIHNLHFAASPSVIYAIRKTKTPFVCTLHNFRLLCPSGILFYKGKPFLSSIGQVFPWTAIRKGVYRNSKLLTFWMGLSMKLHHQAKTWQHCNRFIVLTNNAKQIFLKSRLKFREDQMVVKPNFCSVPLLPQTKVGETFLYVGRLSEEKGIRLLLHVFSSLPYQLQIAGDGPLREEIKTACAQHKNITWLGSLPKEKLLPVMAGATALLFPSIWFEGMPLTIIESFAMGTPVLASRLGAMDDMVTPDYNGFHFEPGNEESIKAAIEAWKQLSAEEKKAYRHNALTTYQTLYTPQKNARQLLAIYNDVIGKGKPSQISWPTKTRPALETSQSFSHHKRP